MLVLHLFRKLHRTDCSGCCCARARGGKVVRRVELVGLCTVGCDGGQSIIAFDYSVASVGGFVEPRQVEGVDGVAIQRQQAAVC